MSKKGVAPLTVIKAVGAGVLLLGLFNIYVLSKKNTSFLFFMLLVVISMAAGYRLLLKKLHF